MPVYTSQQVFDLLLRPSLRSQDGPALVLKDGFANVLSSDAFATDIIPHY